LDINGNNRWLFRRNLYNWWGINRYHGVDIVMGKNVDSIGLVHEILPQLEGFFRYHWRYYETSKPFWPVDVVLSTEMLAHDHHWEKSIKAMYEILKPGGLLLITAAGTGRPEHGTRLIDPSSSPATLDYYKNITNEMFESVLPRELFTDYLIRQNYFDFQFAGIKKK
jgi:SAM-dependent methyltransferase